MTEAGAHCGCGHSCFVYKRRSKLLRNNSGAKHWKAGAVHENWAIAPEARTASASRLSCDGRLFLPRRRAENAIDARHANPNLCGDFLARDAVCHEA